MKTFCIVLIVSFLFSCSSVSRREESLPEKSKFSTFNIELLGQPGQSNKTEIKLIFLNISDDTIRISNPGAGVSPFCTDSNGTLLSTLFHIRMGHEIEEERITLLKGEKYETTYYFSVEQCFELNHSSKYELWFSYGGMVFDMKRHKIAGNKSLLSNKISFIVL